MEFKKIQLNGFKSFADKTNFLIEEGLTGIVGPNGCGKSNIVEAIRFGLGEVSAKQLRGKEIDEIIFNITIFCRWINQTHKIILTTQRPNLMSTCTESNN